MQKQFDDFEKFINEELEREAEEIERELQKHPELASLKASDSLKEKIDAKIEEMERERVISQLSEEDREALLLGREVRKEKEEEKKRREKRRKARMWKRLVAAAAVVVIVASVGITSVGGPKRVVEFMKESFGGRELDTATSVNDEKVLEFQDSEEEKAYQEINDKLGFEPVKITIVPDEMKFKYMELDEYLQTVNMIYELNEMNVSYIMQGAYVDDVWAVDTDDILVDEYEQLVSGVKVIVREYNVKGTKEYKYVGSFEYQEVYYRITAMVKKEKFEKIINNLHFS